MVPAFSDLNKETEIEAKNTMTFELKDQTSFSIMDKVKSPFFDPQESIYI